MTHDMRCDGNRESQRPASDLSSHLTVFGLGLKAVVEILDRAPVITH